MPGDALQWVPSAAEGAWSRRQNMATKSSVTLADSTLPPDILTEMERLNAAAAPLLPKLDHYRAQGRTKSGDVVVLD